MMEGCRQATAGCCFGYGRSGSATLQIAYGTAEPSTNPCGRPQVAPTPPLRALAVDRRSPLPRRCARSRATAGRPYPAAARARGRPQVAPTPLLRALAGDRRSAPTPPLRAPVVARPSPARSRRGTRYDCGRRAWPRTTLGRRWKSALACSSRPQDTPPRPVTVSP